VRHVHANKNRKFNVRVLCCNVISDNDVDFGRILLPNNCESDIVTSVIVEPDNIAHLSFDQQCELLYVLNKFADCFSDKPGLCRVLGMKSRSALTFSRRMRPYRVPESLKPEVEHQIRELLSAGIIVRSNSPMASTPVCVAKKQGGVRLACDYRYVNSFTFADAFPLVTVDKMIREVGKGRVISVFDAKSGYWQYLVAQKDRWLTAFVTHEELYERVRMPFGLRNAGATFVRAPRAVTSILQPLQDFFGSYVDNMAVGSDGWNEHLTHLRLFLSIIKNAGLTFNISKCKFGHPVVRLSQQTHHWVTKFTFIWWDQEKRGWTQNG